MGKCRQRNSGPSADHAYERPILVKGIRLIVLSAESNEVVQSGRDRSEKNVKANGEREGRPAEVSSQLPI